MSLNKFGPTKSLKTKWLERNMLMLDHVKCKWQKIWQLWLFSVNKFVAFHHYRLVQIQTAFPFMKPESNQCLPFSLKDWHLYSVDFVHEALPTYLNVVDLDISIEESVGYLVTAVGWHWYGNGIVWSQLYLLAVQVLWHYRLTFVLVVIFGNIHLSARIEPSILKPSLLNKFPMVDTCSYQDPLNLRAPEVLPIMWINYLISGRKYIWNAHCPPFHVYYKGTTCFCLCNLSSDSLFRVLLWNDVAQR